MFEGEAGKQLMIQQGYVPAGCKLPAEFAGILIHEFVSAGNSPCDGCVHSKEECRETAEVGREEG